MSKFFTVAMISASILLSIPSLAQTDGTGPMPQPACPEEYDEHGLLKICPANTDKTVPTSPYENPKMPLIEQEKASRCSLASLEINRSLGIPIPQYCGSDPVATFAWLTAFLATLALAIKAVWVGIPLMSGVASALQRGFFRWPASALEWINKLAIYIGLADVAWLLVR